MKITIAPVSGTSWGTEIPLTSGGQFSPENITLNGTSLVDVVGILGATSQMPLDRGNETNTIDFQHTNEKSSFSLSEQDLILYKAGLPRLGLIRFYDEPALSTAFAFMIGAITNFTHSQVGVTTIRGFTIAGGAITTTIPSVPQPFP